MRVTESQLRRESALAISKQQERLREASRKMQTGHNIERPSDGVTEWEAGMRADARRLASESRGDAMARSRDNLAEVDRSLGGIINILSRMRELSVQLGNETLEASDRRAAAVEIRTLRDNAIGLANTRGAEGEYLLAGSAGDVPPFAPDGTYQGDAGERSIEVSEGHFLAVTLPGSALTAAEGVDVFGFMAGLADSMDNNQPDQIRAALQDIDASIEQIAGVRTRAGARMSAIDEINDLRDEFELNLAEVRARSLESDPIEAAIELGQSSAALENASAVAERISQLVSGR